MKARNLMIAATVLIAIAIAQLYVQSNTALKLQKSLLALDVSGGDTGLAQTALTSYTSRHMLTGRTVFLSASYARAQQAAIAAATPQSNGQIYAQAQAACGGRSDSITQAKCVTAYVSSHAVPAANPQPVAMPMQADYVKKFDSPAWTPSLAGLCIIAALALLASAASTRL